MIRDEKPIRVLHFCAVDFTVRQFIAPVALALSDAGYDVQCACSRGPHWEELREMGVRMIEVPMARSASPLKGLRSVLALRKVLRRERIEVLHVHTPVAAMVGRLAGWLAGVPLIIYTAHGFYFHDRMPEKKRRVHVALERFFARFNHALFCVSGEDAREAVELGIGQRETTFFISNGVDPGHFDPAKHSGGKCRAEFAIPADAVVITIMGRMAREKGYREFFAAAGELASRHPQARFLVIGDTVSSEHDNAKEEILDQARDPRLAGRVHFAGLRRDIPELLAASDIFCLPSYREGMPVSILEAMAMELPVVATNIRGSREEVLEGETGLIVPAKDAPALAAALEHLLKNADERRRMGLRGRERVMAHFDERKLLAHQVQLYEQLQEGKT